MKIDTTESRVLREMNELSWSESLSAYSQQIATIVETEDWDTPECSVCLPSASSLYQESIAVVDKLVTAPLQYVFLLGIGGSNLGTDAIHAALRNRFSRHTHPELISLDTVSAADITALSERIPTDLSPESYVVFLISKSGTTTETITNAELLYRHVLPDPQARTNRTIVITDIDSALDRYANEQGMLRLHIPEKVGGRFSVFSPVGIAPLHALGHPVVELLRGAQDAVVDHTKADVANNPAALVATKVVAAIEQGYTVYDLFVFDPALEVVGKWHRQLVGESIGKRENKKGEVVETGIVPTVSVGSTDLHSVGQLYLGGLPTVLTMFVSIEQSGTDFTIMQGHTDSTLSTLVPDIAGRSTHDIQQAIFAGTKDAYNEAGRPFAIAELASGSAYEIGMLMQYKMIEVMYIAHLLDINAFDQPNVERYKIFTKEYLRT